MEAEAAGVKTVLVTGASSGIGRELAILCAASGMNLVLVATKQQKLKALAKELTDRDGVAVEVIPADLADPETPQALFERVAQKDLRVDVLINNAGVGAFGPFVELDAAAQMAMIQLNVAALTHLTRLFLPPMLKRGAGRVLNVASTAAFQPGPLMAVYYATKSYVLSFSEAVAEELRGTGVTVTALCPGPTASNFQERADMKRSGLMRLGMMSSRQVAEEGFRAMMEGKAVHVTGLQNKVLAQSIRISPRFLVRRIVKRLQASAG